MNLNISPEIIITGIIGIILILITMYVIKPLETFNNKKGCKINNENIQSPESVYSGNNINNVEKLSTNKILKYFGSNTCPHSMKGSRAYNIIKDFEDSHNDVNVEYYWSGKDTMDEFKKANAMYVPTIINGYYNTVELILPVNTDTSQYDDNQLKDLLLSNIYNQL